MVSLLREEDQHSEHHSYGTTVSLWIRVQRMNNFALKILTQHKYPFQISRGLKSAFKNNIKQRIFAVLFNYLDHFFLYKDKMIHSVKCIKLWDEWVVATAKIAWQTSQIARKNKQTTLYICCNWKGVSPAVHTRWRCPVAIRLPSSVSIIVLLICVLLPSENRKTGNRLLQRWI